MTRCTRDVYNFLKLKSGKSGECWWGQGRIAAELEMHRYSVIQAIAALVSEGLLESVRRGSTSNLYRVREMSQNVTRDVTKCDNASIELNLKKEKKPAGREEHHNWVERNFPAQRIVNEYGATVPNPAFRRVMEALRTAQERIRRARDPLAYERAIIAAETRKTA